MLPNVPPKLFSLSAIIIGYILIDDMTANEQNAVGNWLMLVAQVLSTNAFYGAVMEERGLKSKGSTETGKNNANTFAGSNMNNNYKHFFNACNNNQNDTRQTIDMLEKLMNAIQKEINEIKRNL